MRYFIVSLSLALLVFTACDSKKEAAGNGSDAENGEMTQSTGGDGTTMQSGDSGSDSEDMSDEQTDGPRRYQLQSGIVKYKLSGDQSGTEELYFDRWGMREAKYADRTVHMGDMKQTMKEMVMFDGKYAYNVDLKQRVGMKMKNPMIEELLAKGTTDFSEVVEAEMKRMGGVKKGTEKILGRTCDVWSVAEGNARSWVWKGITLKIDVLMMGMNMKAEAVSVEENPDIPAAKFKIPDDVQITERQMPPPGSGKGQPPQPQAMPQPQPMPQPQMPN